jgi:CheY-like chemotaxis protein
VVDDSAPDLRLLEHLISSLGVEVRAVSNADDALMIARKSRPILIVSDIHMPRRDGLELLEEAKSDEGLKDVPFLLISSSTATAEEQRRAVAVGVNDMILRPLDAEALLERFAKWILAEPRR